MKKIAAITVALALGGTALSAQAQEVPSAPDAGMPDPGPADPMGPPPVEDGMPDPMGPPPVDDSMPETGPETDAVPPYGPEEPMPPEQVMPDNVPPYPGTAPDTGPGIGPETGPETDPYISAEDGMPVEDDGTVPETGQTDADPLDPADPDPMT